MLVLHQVLIYRLHLFAGPVPVIRGSFLRCFFRYAAQHQTTVPDDTLVPTFVNSWCLKVWILVGANGFPPFTQFLVNVDLVFLTTHCDSIPTMHIAGGRLGGI